MENTGRKISAPVPLFNIPSVFVITVALDPSDPAAGIVRITPILKADLILALLSKKSQKSPLYLAPAAIALAESIADPPPTAKMKSTFSVLQISIPLWYFYLWL